MVPLEPQKIHQISSPQMLLKQLSISMLPDPSFIHKVSYFSRKMMSTTSSMEDIMVSGTVGADLLSHQDSKLIITDFLDAIDGSYCTYSAFGETGNCKVEECLDPVYPDPNPGGYKGQLQCGVYKPVSPLAHQT